MVIAGSLGWEAAEDTGVEARLLGGGVMVRVPRRFASACIGRGGGVVAAAQKDLGVEIGIRSDAEASPSTSADAYCDAYNGGDVSLFSRS